MSGGEFSAAAPILRVPDSVPPGGRWSGGATWVAAWFGIALLCGGTARAQPFRFPTANRALYDAGGDTRFLAPTPGRTWESGAFGCARNDKNGPRLHEGLDIKSVTTDKRGEPADPVLATAPGTVAYLNRKAGRSNYGNYALVRHVVDHLEIYSLYAHLSAIQPALTAGSAVAAGDRLGTMGRTGQPIGKDRAHVHFELNVLLNDRFPDWFRRHYPDERNDHGVYHGKNLLGLDPRAILLAQRAEGTDFSLSRTVARQPVMARVAVRQPNLAYARRYPSLVQAASKATAAAGIAGYEVALNFNGVPVQLTPRTAKELAGVTTHRLLTVDETEWRAHPCGRLVIKRGQAWTLTGRGNELMELLAF